MRNQPGISWGYDNNVNLMRSSKGWLAVYYDKPTGCGEIIQIFHPKDFQDFLVMMKQLEYYNYNTCTLCPEVRVELSWIS